MTVLLAVDHRLILDSRGNPTVECEVVTEGGYGRAAAPSGASTGSHEAPAWPKGGPEKALSLARKDLAPALEGADALDIEVIDALIEETDGTPNLSRLGASVTVSTSLAVAKAAADSLGLSVARFIGGATPHAVPAPFANIIGGGAHAIGGTDIQEFMVVARSGRAQERVFANALVHKAAGRLLKERLPGTAIGKGDEGAWVAPIRNEEALEVLAEAIDEVKGETNVDLGIALDVAASELWDGGAYAYREGKRTTEDQVQWLAELVDEHGIISVEDPMDEEDWDGFQAFTEAVGDDCLVVGDDLFTTRVDLLQRGIDEDAANAILIKPNQVGTLTRTLEAVQLAHRTGWDTIMSHRSGETTDETIAHLAWGLGCTGLKTGAVGGERIAKLNELIRLEDER